MHNIKVAIMRRFKKIAGAVLLTVFIGSSIAYKSDFFEIAKQIEIYTTLFKELNLYYIDELDPAEVMDNAIEHTLNNLDPYTKFYDEQGVIDARIVAEGQYGGIGASVRYREGNLIVDQILKDYAADEAGLKVGDVIVAIDNTELKSQEEDFVRSLLRGLPDSEVKLEINRNGNSISKTIQRETVEINPVPYYTMIDDEVGYLAFIKFNRKASDEVKNAYEALKSQGMKQLIIDVRHNPGGLLNEAVEIVNFFIPKNQVVVTTRAKIDKWSSTFKTKNEPLDTEIPLAILIDDRSASASEILAGALQDYDRAVIVGQRSFGKGLVQRSRKLSYGTQLKLTISKYYTPSGRCIQELDYTNRVGDSIPKFSDGIVNEFTTQNGRKVYDGGGVSPDVEIAVNEKSEATQELLRSFGLFDFATQFCLDKETIEEASKFKLPEKTFKELQSFLEIHPESFELNSEELFEKAISEAQQESLELSNAYDDFMKVLNKQKINQLQSNKAEILDALEAEIVSRYYYKEGEYEHKVSFDNSIKKAVELLHNSQEYFALLN